MGLDDFLKEETRASRGEWLKSWKKEGSIVVWLHTRAKIHGRWAHQFPYVEAREDKETRKVTRVLRQLKFGCWESDAILTKRAFRDKDGAREMPPGVCPLCLLQEAVIADSKLAGDTIIFRAKGSDWEGAPAEVAYQKGNLTGEFKRTSKSWKENIDVRKTYLFTVVVDRAPGEGPKIAEESQSLGDAVRMLIKQEIDSEGAEAGNPSVTPYALKWTFDKDSKKPADFYKAYRYRQAKYTDEIQEQIAAADPPNLATYCAKGDVFTLRSYVEAAMTAEAKKVFDLDEFFAKAEAIAEKENGGKKAEPRTAARSEAQEPAPAEGGRRRKKVEAKPEPMGDPCDECGRPMKKGQLKCSCGAEYEDDATAVPEPQSSRRTEPAPDEDDDLPF
jgi:hypothetical protein